jgi:hypothetical protein
MPRFYFHIKHGDRLVEDKEGDDFPDLALARAQALEAAREMWSEAIKTGRELIADAFVITDEQGHRLLLVPMTEALPKRLRAMRRPT